LKALPGLGLGTVCQAVPFQCSIRVLLLVPSLAEPTAQMLDAEAARTLFRKLLPLPGSGLSTCAHENPFQCSIRVWYAPPLRSKPAAHTSHGESTATLLREFSRVPGLGGCAPVQAWQLAAEAAAGPVPANKLAITSSPPTAVKVRLASHRVCICGSPPRPLHGAIP
jgi:hypothetical protein